MSFWAAQACTIPFMDRPCPFQLMAHVNEVMGNAPYDRCHTHRPGVQALCYNQPQLILVQW